MNRDHQILWEVSKGETTTMCVMVSCCGGAELQVVRATHGDEEIILRELYPDRSSVHERARELQNEARAARGERGPQRGSRVGVPDGTPQASPEERGGGALATKEQS